MCCSRRRVDESSDYYLKQGRETFAIRSGLNILGKKGKNYFHLRDEDNSQSYLFNKIGKLPSFPIFSASDLDVAVGVNQDFITTKGDEDEVLLYTIN